MFQGTARVLETIDDEAADAQLDEVRAQMGVKYAGGHGEPMPESTEGLVFGASARGRMWRWVVLEPTKVVNLGQPQAAGPRLMARIPQLPPEQWDPSLAELVKPEQRTPLETGLMRYFAHRPELAAGLAGFSGALKRHRQLDPRLAELVRLRIAFHNQCRSCMAIRYSDAVDAGLTEGAVCSLATPMDAPDLTEAERVAVRFGELFATDHLAIDDAPVRPAPRALHRWRDRRAVPVVVAVRGRRPAGGRAAHGGRVARRLPRGRRRPRRDHAVGQRLDHGALSTATS